MACTKFKLAAASAVAQIFLQDRIVQNKSGRAV